MAEKTAAKQFGKHRHWFHAGLAVLLLALQLFCCDPGHDAESAAETGIQASAECAGGPHGQHGRPGCRLYGAIRRAMAVSGLSCDGWILPQQPQLLFADKAKCPPACLVRTHSPVRGAAGRGFLYSVRSSSTVRASASGWGNTGTQVTLSTGWKRREE